MYIAAEHAQFLDVDPTGADSRVIDEISHYLLGYLAECQKKVQQTKSCCAYGIMSVECFLVCSITRLTSKDSEQSQNSWLLQS